MKKIIDIAELSSMTLEETYAYQGGEPLSLLALGIITGVTAVCGTAFFGTFAYAILSTPPPKKSNEKASSRCS